VTLKEQIRANRWRTLWLLLLFAVLVGVLGGILALVFNLSILIVVAIVAFVYAIFSWFASGRIVAAVTGARPADRAQYPRLYHVLETVAIAAGLPQAPPVYVIDDPAPNAFAAGRSPKKAYVAVTTGLLNLMSERELEAVLAHELCHIVHRDATVMSVVGLPGAVLSEGAGRIGGWGWWPIMVGAFIVRLVAAVTSVGTKALSRYRETAADAAAARLTGSPAALASALLKVSGQLTVIPSEDARVAAARNAFNLLPVAIDGRDDGWWDDLARSRALSRLSATHPSIERRVAALEELERGLHRARPSAAWLDER